MPCENITHDTQMMEISNDYIRGLVEGGGSFTFSTTRKRVDGTRYKLPAFVISLHIRDKNLLQMIRDKLGLKSKIYYKVPGVNIQNAKTGAKYLSARQAILIVRDFKQLKDIIIPFFYKKLKGYKGRQFMEWLEKKVTIQRFRIDLGLYIGFINSAPTTQTHNLQKNLKIRY